MPLNYPLTPPAAFKTQRATWRAISQNALAMSPFTYQIQVQNGQGQRWEVDIELPPLLRTDADAVDAFLTALGGPSGSFYYGPVLEKQAKGVATGTPLVNGASQSGNVDLITDGWTAGVTGIMKAGDYIQIGTRLYKVLADADSDGSGNATLTLFPRVRPGTNNNDPIITFNPKGIFYMTSTAAWDADINKIFTIKLTASELV